MEVGSLATKIDARLCWTGYCSIRMSWRQDEEADAAEVLPMRSFRARRAPCEGNGHQDQHQLCTASSDVVRCRNDLCLNLGCRRSRRLVGSHSLDMPRHLVNARAAFARDVAPQVGRMRNLGERGTLGRRGGPFCCPITCTKAAVENEQRERGSFASGVVLDCSNTFAGMVESENRIIDADGFD